jgi:hypothetical protein
MQTSILQKDTEGAVRGMNSPVAGTKSRPTDNGIVAAGDRAGAAQVPFVRQAEEDLLHGVVAEQVHCRPIALLMICSARGRAPGARVEDNHFFTSLHAS